MINKLVEQIVPQPVGTELLRENTDALTLLANGNTELNERPGELIKLTSHNYHMH